MPIYEYIARDATVGCGVCRCGFELRRPVGRPELEVCPLCRASVRKVVSRVNAPRITKPLSVSAAKSAGFTVLEKRDKGVYEKL